MNDEERQGFLERLGKATPRERLLWSSVRGVLAEAPRPMASADIAALMRPLANCGPHGAGDVLGLLMAHPEWVTHDGDQPRRWSLRWQSLPDQVAHMPAYGRQRSRPPCLIPPGQVIGTGELVDVESDLIETLQHMRTNGVTIYVLTTAGQPLLRMTVDHVLDRRPWWIAWAVIPGGGAGAASLIHAGCWHLWTLGKPIDWRSPTKNLLPPERVTAAGGAVATWRAKSPLDAACAVFSTLSEKLGVRSANRLAFEVDRCSPDEGRRRTADANRVPGPRTGSSREVPSGAPLAYCSQCNRPLHDPVSAQIGIGPECRARLNLPWLSRAESHPGVPLHYWIGAQPLSLWQQRVMSAAQAVGVSRDQLGR